MCTTGTVSVVAVAPVMFTDLPNGRDVNGVIGKAHTCLNPRQLVGWSHKSTKVFTCNLGTIPD